MKTHRGIARGLRNRAVSQGTIRVPAVPAMLDEYVRICLSTFSALGVEFDPEQVAKLRSVLDEQLIKAYEESHRSEIVISYESPIGDIVNYHVAPQWTSLDVSYDNWMATRQPPLFGTYPDARVLALLEGLMDPASCHVLDLGAGTGRNALALARRGHPVDAVEITPSFAAVIREATQAESLDIRVYERDVFATIDDLRRDYGVIVLSEVVSDYRSLAELRSTFEIAATCLAPGGLLVFNAFLAADDFVPDEAARQWGQQTYSTIYTRSEVKAAVSGFPLTLLSDDSVYEFERGHLPDEAWPPTGWYAHWVSGHDVFWLPREESPIELRWQVYRKAD